MVWFGKIGNPKILPATDGPVKHISIIWVSVYVEDWLYSMNIFSVCRIVFPLLCMHILEVQSVVSRSSKKIVYLSIEHHLRAIYWRGKVV